MTAFAIVSLLLAFLPAVLVLRNLRVFHSPPPSDESADEASILIPARDEAQNISAAVEAALRNRGAEVLVLDDGSTDETAALVRRISERGPGVRLVQGRSLPPRWCGKNWACAQLAEAATRPLLLFVDADVRLAPSAAAAVAAWMRANNVQLASGVPHQELGSFAERLLIPLIHFVLLGFLPFRRMRQSRDPRYAAGCGQFIMVNAAAYRQSGGHATRSDRPHDGLALPTTFREAGFRTDLIDATNLASCRMYENSAQVWQGLSKNTHEGLGAPARIVPITLLLLVGQVVPFLLLAASRWVSPTASFYGAIAGAIVLSTRLTLAGRFRQPIGAALLHPIGIVALLAIQWTGLVRWLSGQPARWKSREYAPRSAGDRVATTDTGEHLPEGV